MEDYDSVFGRAHIVGNSYAHNTSSRFSQAERFVLWKAPNVRCYDGFTSLSYPNTYFESVRDYHPLYKHFGQVCPHTMSPRVNQDKWKVLQKAPNVRPKRSFHTFKLNL